MKGKLGLATVAYIIFLCTVTVAYAGYTIYSNSVTDTVSEYTLGTLSSSSQSGLLYTNVTFTGQLLLGATGSSGKTVYLMRSEDQSAWTSVASTTTDGNGVFQFQVNRTESGTWYYKARFDVP